MSKKITVPGTTGNIGTALIHHLLKQSHQVTAVARPSARLDAQAQAGATPKAGDAHDAPSLTEALRGAGLSENMADLYDEMTRNINDGKSIATPPATRPAPRPPRSENLLKRCSPRLLRRPRRARKGRLRVVILIAK